MVENREKNLNPSITANRKPKLRESYKNFFQGLSPGVNFRRVPNFNRSVKTPQIRDRKKVTKTLYGVLAGGALGENYINSVQVRVRRAGITQQCKQSELSRVFILLVMS